MCSLQLKYDTVKVQYKPRLLLKQASDLKLSACGRDLVSVNDVACINEA